MSSEYFSIIPSNNPVSNSYSFSSGQSLINVIIPPSESRLVGSSVKLNGRIEIGGGLGEAECNLNPRVALMSLIESISISSHETGQSIETIKFYPRFLSSFFSTLNSEEDLLGFMSVTRASTDSQGGATRSVGRTGVHATNQQDFSFSLPTGLLLSEVGIPLDKVGGLFISLQLSNNENLFRADTGKSPTMTVSNVHLSGLTNIGSSTADEMTYNSVSSYYGVINSAFGTLQYNLGLSKVLGAWVNFLPSEMTNTYAYDGQATLPLMSTAQTPVQPTEINFLKGGVKFPLDYSIRDEFTSSQTLFNSQVTRNYMNALKKFSSIGRTDVGPNNTNLARGFAAANFIDDNLAGDIVYGIGCRFDSTSDSGVSFLGDTFGITIASGLVTNYNNSAYLFVHHKNTLVFGKDGVKVLN